VAVEPGEAAFEDVADVAEARAVCDAASSDAVGCHAMSVGGGGWVVVAAVDVEGAGP
jgi:hypothetical protein